MDKSILGLHHVTMIASDPQRNVDFYAGVLGLRLVKLTINYDDPGTYHLYYGDGAGSPGTILTFFPWPTAPRGRQGTGQTTLIALAVPPDSLDYWEERLRAHLPTMDAALTRAADRLTFSDPDGLPLALVAQDAALQGAWTHSPVPVERAIRGLHGVTLTVEGGERTKSLLTETMGFRITSQERNAYRFAIGDGGIGTTLDLLCTPGGRAGTLGAGSVHHIAWRTPDDAQQEAWLNDLRQLRYNPSPVMDRQYFHSIYFREPGGVLFEIATDPPGFATDETPETMGTRLRLPDWLEPSRAKVEAILPPLRLPNT